jgi:hypothetical protein
VRGEIRGADAGVSGNEGGSDDDVVVAVSESRSGGKRPGGRAGSAERSCGEWSAVPASVGGADTVSAIGSGGTRRPRAA